jgi:GWxTD domain-containing protein
MTNKNISLLISFSILSCLLVSVGCSLSTKAALDPNSRSFLEYASLIMTRAEKDIFNHLPDQESRMEFINEFWAKRDPDPGTEFNEFREEFYRRIEYANERFNEGIPGWKTDRGRMYIYFGEPDQKDIRPMLDNPQARGYFGYILWQYYRYSFAIMFVDKRGNGSYTFEPYVGGLGTGGGIVGDFFSAMERAQFGLPLKTSKFDKKFLDFDLKYIKGTQEFKLLIPVDSITFIAEGNLLKAEFDFLFTFYRKKSPEKKTYQDTRRFEAAEEETVELKNIEMTFTFPDLSPGKYYADVVISGKADIGKARKIFDINY